MRAAGRLLASGQIHPNDLDLRRERDVKAVAKMLGTIDMERLASAMKIR